MIAPPNRLSQIDGAPGSYPVVGGTVVADLVTLTGPAIYSGIVTCDNTTGGPGNKNISTNTAANLLTQLAVLNAKAAEVGSVICFSTVPNGAAAADTYTLDPQAGVTIDGEAVVAPGVGAEWELEVTSATTVTISRIG